MEKYIRKLVYEERNEVPLTKSRNQMDFEKVYDCDTMHVMIDVAL